MRRHDWHGHLVVLAAIVIGLAGFAWAGTSTAKAQPSEYPCVGMLTLSELDVDPRLTGIDFQVTSARVVHPSDAAKEVDEVRMTFAGATAESGVACLWIQVKRPGETGFTSMAEFILQGPQTAFSKQVVGVPGEYCFRFVPLSATGRGEIIERCLELELPLGPVSPPSGPGDAPAPPATGGGLQHSSSAVDWWLGLAGIAFASVVLVGWPVVRRR